MKRISRDNLARQEYQSKKRDLQTLKNDLYMLDILLITTGQSVDVIPMPHFERSPVYWAAWSLAYYQWYSGYSFEEIYKALPFTELLNMYATFHEADINKSVSVADEVLIESKRKSETHLSRLRKARGLSQKELAETSGVALRMIQLYEQKQNNINKAQSSSLQSLAQALGCKIEDLFE